MNKKRNMILLVSVTLAAALGGILVQQIGTGKKGAYAIVQVNGEEQARLNLSEDTSLEIKGDEGSNLILVRDGKISVSQADCPDKSCVKEGEKSKDGQVIACLPNKLIITIKSDREGQEEKDAVAW